VRFTRIEFVTRIELRELHVQRPLTNSKATNSSNIARASTLLNYALTAIAVSDHMPRYLLFPIVAVLLAALLVQARAFADAPAPFEWQTRIAGPAVDTSLDQQVTSPTSPRRIEALSQGRWRLYFGRYTQVRESDGAFGPAVQSYGQTFTGPASARLIDGGSVTIDGRDPFDVIESDLTAAISPINGPRETCTVRKFFANGELAWRSSLSGLYGLECSHVLEVGRQIWVFAQDRVIRLGPDGARLGEILLRDAAQQKLYVCYVSGDADGVYLVANTSDAAAPPSNSQKSYLLRLGVTGAEAWRFHGNGAEVFGPALIAPDGVLLSSVISNTESVIIKLARDGVLQARNPISGRMIKLASDSQGFARALIVSNQTELALTSVDQNGVEVSRQTLVAAQADAEFEFVGRSLMMCGQNSVTVFDALGRMRAQAALDSDTRDCPAALALDGEVLLSPVPNANCAPNCGKLLRLDLQTGARSFWTAQAATSGELAVVSAFEVNGGVLVSTRSGAQLQTRYLDQSGVERWRRDSNEERMLPNRVVANQNTYCVLKLFSPVNCYDIQSNSLRFSINETAFIGEAKLIADRLLLREGRDESSAVFRAYDFQGNRLFDRTQPEARFAGLSELGFYALRGQEFQRWNPSGELISRHDLAVSTAIGASPTVILLDDGAMVWDQAELSYLALNGAVRWRYRSNTWGALSDVKLLGNRVLLALSKNDGLLLGQFGRSELAGQLIILSATDGSVIGNHEIEAIDTQWVNAPIAQAPTHYITAIGADSRNAEVRYVVDVQSGELIDVQANDLSQGRALSQGLFLSVRAPNYLIRTAHNLTSGIELLLAKRRLTTRASLPIGSPSFLGAWHSPQLPGQGFFIQRINDVQFLTWFFGLPGSELSSTNLSWLTIQGVVPGNTQRAKLKIYRTAGADFLSGNASVEEVGLAELSFQSCSKGTLRYQIDAREGAGSRNAAPERGVMALEALLPATACAGPLSLPAPISAKTGLFADTNLFGQGMMTIENQGHFFAGWFTYDPAGARDDDYGHHWLTLQGNATPGSSIVQTQIYRTLGTVRNRVNAASVQAIGSARFDFRDCRTLVFSYQFLDDELALAMRGKSGTVQWQRNGACP
jgi:hypothetical protein